MVGTVGIRLGVLAAVAAVAALLSGCAAPGSGVAAQTPVRPAATRPSAVPAVHQVSRHVRHAHKRSRAIRVPADVPMPNREITPGSIQSSDTAAICTPGWAEAHRNVSEATKNYVASEYGLASRYGYEIDHLIPLELGGSNTVSNLWPEPYNSRYGAYQKDGLEDWLHEQVCYHGLSLAVAQREIAVNWYAAWVNAGRPLPSDFGYGPAPTPAPSHPAGGSATCSVSGTWDATYGDWDVYVHSNQLDQTVTVSGGGVSDTWHTDASGYADVYFHAGQGASGETVTASVGAASCSGTLG